MVTIVPVRSRRLSSSPDWPLIDLRRARQRELDFGDRRDRDFGRQHVVEDMIVAQIGVGEDIVADPLAGAQTAAMADHQPCLGPQHREMVADRLGVGRADADIDQRDAGAVVGHQMIGRHLVPPPRAGIGHRRVDIVARAQQHAARAGQRR